MAENPGGSPPSQPNPSEEAASQFDRGNALFGQNRIEEAVSGYERAIALAPAFAEAQHNRGVALQRLGRLPEALASFDRALALKPEYVDAHASRGNVLMDLSQPEAALASYDSALALNAAFAPAHFNRGGALRALNRPDEALASIERGLPTQGLVFCCFNNNHKILPDTFDIWMRLLMAVAGSVLWLLGDNPTAVRNLRKEAEARGVDSHRLVFAERLPPDQHLARHRLADLFLDTLPYNAHTTATDALWAGLPVLTRPGSSFSSRVAASLLLTLGLPELVTDNAAAYEAKALELARDPAKLADIKQRIAANRQTSPLFDGKLFVRHLEAAFTTMHERALAGLPPASFSVDA